MKVTLTKSQYEKLTNLEEGVVLEVTFNGIDAYITPDENGNIEYKGHRYTFNFYCPSKVKLSVKSEPKSKEVVSESKKVTIIGAEFDPKKMHVYGVKTTGKHPVHLIEGGAYITEDDRDFDPSGDMGWYWLNQKEYDYFKSQCHEITIE